MMQVTNLTTSDIYFGPLHLPASGTLMVDDTSATSLYLLSDAVADALNNAYKSGQISVSGQAEPFPRPTGDPTILHGSGDPEGLVFAPQGSVYMRRDGVQTNGGVLYMKTTGGTFSTGWLDLATASGATAVLPPGLLSAFAGAVVPTGWLLCDGSAISRTTYSLLFTAVGTAYGAGDGTSTFNLPDLRGRGPVGVGTNADVASLGNSDGLALGSRSPRHATSLAGAPGLTGTPGVSGAPGLTGSPGISDPGHVHGVSDPGHAHTAYGWEATSGSNVGMLHTRAGQNDQIGGIGPLTATTGISIQSHTTGIGATIGSLSATIGSLDGTIGSLAATIGSLAAGPGGSRPTDTSAYQAVNYIIKT